MFYLHLWQCKHVRKILMSCETMQCDSFLKVVEGNEKLS
jgi:hypothetical protein